MQYKVSFQQEITLRIHVTVDAEDAIEAMVRAGTIAIDCEPNITVNRTEVSYGLDENAEFDTNFRSFKWHLAEDWLEQNLPKEDIGGSHESEAEA